jgi:hypothetical protein
MQTRWCGTSPQQLHSLHLHHLSQYQHPACTFFATINVSARDRLALSYACAPAQHVSCSPDCHCFWTLLAAASLTHRSGPLTLVCLAGGTQINLSTNTFDPSSQPSSLTVRVQRPATHASSDDVVALYVHPSDPRSTLPITWQNLTVSSFGYPATGSGSVTFRLLNFRHNFIVRLVGNGTFSPVVLAESVVIQNTNPNLPGQVHLALHADGSSVVVQWVSGSPAPQQLLYGNTSVQFTNLSPAGSAGNTHARQYSSTTGGAAVVASTSRSYDRRMMCGDPATTFGFIHPGYMHTAVIPSADVGYNRLLHYRCETIATTATGCRAIVCRPAAVSTCCSR